MAWDRTYYTKTSTGEPLMLGLGAIRMLAGLLLADGRIVRSREIAGWALPWRAARASPRQWARQARGVGCRIETIYPHGYRLLEIPPDDILDLVLLEARQLRLELPMLEWHLIGLESPPPPEPRTLRALVARQRAAATFQTRATPSPASSARRSA